MSSSVINEALCYETILLLYKERRKANSIFTTISHKVDISEPLPSFLPEASVIMDMESDEVLDAWRIVRNAFESSAFDCEIIPRRSPLFPPSATEEFPFFYASPRIEALKHPYIAFMGTHQPSIKGRSDELNVISELVKSGVGVLAPLETGMAAYALSYAIKLGGRAIAVMETPLSKCASEEILDIQKDVYENGLLISVFAPHVKSEKWHKKIRNDFISSIASSMFIAEEKDGGGAWSVASSILDHGGSLMIAASLQGRSGLTFPETFIKRGALTLKKDSDIKRIIKKRSGEASLPDLFS